MYSFRLQLEISIRQRSNSHLLQQALLVLSLPKMEAKTSANNCLSFMQLSPVEVTNVT